MQKLVGSAFAALVLVVVASGIARGEEPADKAKALIRDAYDYRCQSGCPARARAKLDEADKLIAGLDEFKKDELSKESKSERDSLEGWISGLRAETLVQSLEREFNEAQTNVESAKSGWGGADSDASLEAQLKKITDCLTDDFNVKLIPADQIAKLSRKVDYIRSEYQKAKTGAWVQKAEENSKKIQEVLDGKNKNVYANNVEDWFKWAGENLDKCPKDDPRVTKLRETLAAQRKTFDAQQSSGEHDAVVKPMVDYWKYCHENYDKEAEGWEQETTATSLTDFLHHSPPSLGCDKTEKLLEQVVQRYLGDDRVKQAVAKYPNDAEVKKTYDEAKALLEKAGQKVCSFAAKILEEGEKLPAGRDREELISHFYNLKVTLNNATKGCSANAALIARIDALDKRFGQEKAQGEAAKEALIKKLTDSTNAVWPDMKGAYSSKFTSIDSNEAIENIGKWKGTVLHFEGGGPGVNLNRSGWSWYDDYEFIVEVRGVPICGDFDSGLAEAIKAVRAQTGNLEPYNCEECVGIVDGVCKASPRVQNPLDHNRYFRDTPQKGVHMRIVAWKACTVAACVGKGTNLQKLSEYKEVSVRESGSSSGGGGSSSGGSSGGGGFLGHMVHRLIAWGMCFLLVLGGGLTAAHGASKFVPQIQEQKAKLGDYLGYAGIGFAVVGVLWFAAAIGFWVLEGNGGSLPSIALIFAGAFTAVDLARSKGKLKEETATMIQPLGILLGLACFAAAGVHFLFWNWTLL